MSWASALSCQSRRCDSVGVAIATAPLGRQLPFKRSPRGLAARLGGDSRVSGCSGSDEPWASRFCVSSAWRISGRSLTSPSSIRALAIWACQAWASAVVARCGSDSSRGLEDLKNDGRLDEDAVRSYDCREKRRLMSPMGRSRS